ncbi:MAG TPA: NotI family restriction endonuclease [Terriglobales bacterium]|nr:NotI family restriction endonuclease [Terriglobales bacterium]
MAKRTHPLGEVFGFPTDNFSEDAERHRTKKLCPFNNKIPNCNKDKANNPLGTCSITYNNGLAVTCPIRFRQDWIIADHGAEFFFPKKSKWTSLSEVRLKDKNDKSAGNVDLVLVQYDDGGKILDFGAVEIQSVYISGNVRKPFEYYMEDPRNRADMNWKNQEHWPAPDFLSSSRKRLAPQLIFKSGILNQWRKKTAVVLDTPFFATLPKLTEVPKEDAEIAWLVYDLKFKESENQYILCRNKTIYTRFASSLDEITKSEAGNVCEFVNVLQEKLDDKLGNGSPSDTNTIDQLL